jgi:2-C-methyl-D-erythritol 4-phosphate cytidylyltransferase
MIKKFALIVAGGSGTRMNTSVPKQFIELDGLPVLMHTINRFHAFDPSMEIVLVLPSLQFSVWNELCQKHHFTTVHRLIAGGEVRFDSVKNGLSSIDSEGIVAIHDGVRPLVGHSTIGRCIATTLEKGNAIPVMPVVESLRKVGIDESTAVDRSQFVTIQTPQVFFVPEIKKAYELGYDPRYTDDAMVLERLGKRINLVEGNRENIKITHRTDLVIASALLKNII